MLSKNSLSYPILIAGFIATTLLALSLRPTPHHAFISMTNADKVAISYLWQADISKQNCQEKLRVLDEVVLEHCPDCVIQQQLCLASLSDQQKTMLSSQALTTPSIRLHDGVIAYQAADATLALRVCQQDAQIQSDFRHRLKCLPSDTLRPMVNTQHYNFWQDLAEMALLLLSAGLISWLICYLILRYESLHAQYSHDHTHAGIQKFHAQATPRIGGIALFAGLLASVAIEIVFNLVNPSNNIGFAYFIIASAPVFLGGIIEDVTKNVGVAQRLLFSMVSAAIAIWLLGALINRTDIPHFDTLLLSAPIAIAFTVLGISGVCHAMNIIDGYHGLSAGYASIALVALIAVAFQVNDHLVIAIGVALLGSLLGFLRWNWPHGKIFMGDGGAYLLGFSLAELAILLLYRNPSVSPWFTASLMAYPIVETLYSMFRRKVIAKTKTGLPDDQHLHQLIFSKIIRGHAKNRPEQLNHHNSRVALYIWLPAALNAAVVSLFWSNSTILMPLTLAGCVLYVLVYRKLLSLPD
jgi:UDP-N-acetylmuramyl pentapeptide phosphotransferase/UDP-N-acetylglucosamine-1-phosphate transferase